MKKNVNKITKTCYELYWKDGMVKNSSYQKVGGLYRTIRGVIKMIRANCNHSHGSGFRVYAITNGIRIEIDYRTYLNKNYAS